MGTGQVGPAYQSEESEGRRGERKVAALRRELEELRSRMDTFNSELVVRGEGTASQLEWRSAVEKVEARLRGVEERVEGKEEEEEDRHHHYHSSPPESGRMQSWRRHLSCLLCSSRCQSLLWSPKEKEHF